MSYITKDGAEYSDDRKTLIICPENCKGVFVVPNGVTTIESYAFCDSEELESVVLPFGVTSIGDHAFSGCTSLTSIVIPDSVKSIGAYAFAGCSKLKTVKIFGGVTAIKDSTFCGCKELTSINLPDSVTSIGIHAFSSCDNLKSIYIPKSVRVVNKFIASHCSPDLAVYCEGEPMPGWDKEWTSRPWDVLPAETKVLLPRLPEDDKKDEKSITYNTPRWWYEKYIEVD